MPQQVISQFERAYNYPLETYRQVVTAANRDAIPTGVRWLGMFVHVTTDQQTYELIGGLDNGSWVEVGSGGGTTTIVEDLLTSTSQTNALSANQGRVLNEALALYVPKAGSTTITGTLTAAEFIRTSDRTLKHQIDSYKPKAIDAHWVTFYWGKGGATTGRKQLGLIAQELEINHPEFVITNNDTGLKGVDYTQVLISKVVELEYKLNLIAERYASPRPGSF